MAHTLTLYHYWRSSCSWRVRWALALKQLSYKSVPVNLLKGEQQDPAFKLKNPSGCLPCLEIDGVFVGESLAILEWLEEVYPLPALLPQDPISRLQVRQAALTIVAGTQPLQNLQVQKYYGGDERLRQEQARHWIMQGLGVYERLLERGRPGTYSFGGFVSMADLCLVPQVYNALRFGVDLSKFPLIKGIYERCLLTPACEQSAPHNQPGAS